MNTSAFSSVGKIQSMASLPVHSVLGVDVIILSGGADTGGAFSSYHATCGKGAGAPPHLHRDADEAFLILEGEFDLLCGDQV
jgi:mannose-6-phosphate isomerase-like protein (cupin superfamily)